MSVKKCQNCGYENDSTMNFCLECGIQLVGNPLSAAKTEILPATGRSEATVVLPKKKSRQFFWIFGGLASLLILLLLGFITTLYLARRIRQNNVSVITPTPVITSTRKPSPTPKKAADVGSSNTSVETPETEETTAPEPNFTPPAKPTAQGVFNVKADKNWQLSNLDVVPNEKFVLLAVGSVNLGEIKKDVSPEGVADKKYQTRRLFPEFPAGALLMRTRYADGKYSKISAVANKKASGIWQNAPDERGRLEFCINDNAPDGNDGEFVVSLAIIEE
ncbi:MAG: zinc ribbon domain-containing protein [Acidobacteria bacterium]|jgi:hypothetical protein|nr:zinc ribbon domain-containing protein [Acidobacteriota bacterium]MBA4122540.1 zinc ribbon domain-containing protein [Acidobacteriota bacterium]